MQHENSTLATNLAQQIIINIHEKTKMLHSPLPQDGKWTTVLPKWRFTRTPSLSFTIPGNKNPTRPWLGWATLKCSPTTPVLHLLVLTIYLGILSNKKKYKKLIENDQLKLIYSTEVMYLCMFWNVTKISTCHEIEMFLLSHFVTEFSKCHRMSQNFRQTCFVTECRHVTGNPFSETSFKNKFFFEGMFKLLLCWRKESISKTSLIFDEQLLYFEKNVSYFLLKQVLHFEHVLYSMNKSCIWKIKSYISNKSYIWWTSLMFLRKKSYIFTKHVIYFEEQVICFQHVLYFEQKVVFFW